MNKYIDADKLKAELRKHLMPTVLDMDYDEWENGNDAGLHRAIDIITSLQQEQPEVDLVKEYDEQFDSDPVFRKLVNRNAGIAIARHFWNNCFNARKE